MNSKQKNSFLIFFFTFACYAKGPGEEDDFSLQTPTRISNKHADDDGNNNDNDNKIDYYYHCSQPFKAL